MCRILSQKCALGTNWKSNLLSKRLSKKKKKKVVGKNSSRAAFAAEHFCSQSLEKGIMISVAFIKVCDKNQ